MNHRYPVRHANPSSPKLFAGFDPMKAAVDNPMFYKDNVSRGEFFSLTEANSAFRPDATMQSDEPYKRQEPLKAPHNLTHGLPSASTSSSQLPCDRFQELTYFDDDDMESDLDMEFDSDIGDEHYLDTTQYHHWTDWCETEDRLFPMPLSTAHSSSLESTQHPSLTNHEVQWRGSHTQPYCSQGQNSPLHPFDGSDRYPVQGSHPNHRPLYPQPSSNAFNSASSSSVLLSSSRRAHPPINTVSPFASSDISSSASSPLSSPELTIRTPITLHQPRPSRRIPIVSLSELALACDDPPSSKSPPYKESLSPLRLDFPVKYTSVFSPVHPTMSGGPRITAPQFTHRDQMYTHHFGAIPGYHSRRDPEEVVLCSCGCMESYTIPQNYAVL